MGDGNLGLGAMGKMLVFLGLGILVLGVVLIVASKLGGVPRLPGDVVIERKNWTVYAPFGLMILVSVVLTILLNLFARR